MSIFLNMRRTRSLPALPLPSVVVTPHIGGATVDVVRHQSEVIVEAIERYLRGERPRWIANPAVLDGRR